MRRREFLHKAAATSAILPLTIGGLSLRAFGKSELFNAFTAKADCDDRVLVLVQLVGGNDGLNTLIPLDQYATYFNARQNIAIAEKDVIKLNDTIGFHPSLSGFDSLYKEGKLCIVQNVGYPTPNFSHFRSVDIWTSGSEYDQYVTTGWLGRYLEDIYPKYPFGYPTAEVPDPVAIQVGSIISPVLDGAFANLGMAFTNPDSFYDINEYSTKESMGDSQIDDTLSYIRSTGDQIHKFAIPVKEAAAKSSVRSKLWLSINKNPLAEQLKVVAQLIAGGLKTKVYVVALPGFDNHSSQNIDAGATAPHPKLLAYLSTAIKAFQDDLKINNLEHRVLGMTFSEFGRRIISNSAAGTDHGAAAPLFLFGATVNGGIVGSNPVLPEKPSVEDNLEMKIDFRSVYATILKDWFCAEESTIKKVLYKNFKPLSIIS